MIYLLAGKKGSGKSLYCISRINKYKKRYKYFFANFPVKNFIQIHSLEWVNFRYPKDTCILIDEAQLYFNSREFSKLTKSGLGMQLLDYLTMCRHYDVDVYFITQSSNRIDLQIRELSDYVFQIKKTYKIPFIQKPFLVRGLEFLDMEEYEKYMNPNNFSSECKARWLFKIIKKNDLKAYDTHYIEPKYFDKPMADLICKWFSEEKYKKPKNSFSITINVITNYINKFLFKMFKFKKNNKRAIQNYKDSQEYKDIYKL